MRHRSSTSADLDKPGPLSPPSKSQARRLPATSHQKSSVIASKSIDQAMTAGNGSQEPLACTDLLSATSNSPACTLSSGSLPNMSMLPQDSNLATSLPRPTFLGRDIYLDIRVIMQQMDNGVELSNCFIYATNQPPITLESLMELDLARIINNPKLRHDVNFDRELHFRPNLDGCKGKQKAQMADVYWKALQGELTLYGVVQQRKRAHGQVHEEEYWLHILTHSQQRLPKMFHAIRDILKTLVPDHDQRAVTERLDVDLIMQEIKNGVCDLLDLGNWLARMLHKHCAPMRDELIENMRKDIQQGAAQQKPGQLVHGLRQLFYILEAMKLDVANHQIRHMRPLLVGDSINFQRRYNTHRIAVQKIEVASSKRWVDYEVALLRTEESAPAPVEALSSALLRTILFNDSTGYPPTFYRDTDRLRILRSDLQSAICREICREILVEMMGAASPVVEVRKAITALNATMAPIVGSSTQFSDRLENLAAEIMRLILVAEKRSSFDSVLLDFVEQRLETDLHLSSMAYEKHAQAVYDRILPKLLDSVNASVKLSALQLQEQLVPQVPVQVSSYGFGAICRPGAPQQSVDPDDHIVRRFTHILVLHWQTWAQLVYLATPANSDSATPTGSDVSSPATSTTIPVAQAVYAPGRKWLPIGVTVTEIPGGLPTPEASPVPGESEDHDTDSASRHPDDKSTTSQHEQAGLDDEWRQPA